MKPPDKLTSGRRGGALLNTARRRERGTAMVESTLVLMPLLSIMFAMIDYSFGIFLQNTLRNSVREAVRFGIAQKTGPGGQDAGIRTAAITNSFGFLSQADINSGKSTFTIAYYDGATLAPTSSNIGGNLLVITASIESQWIAPVWRAAGVVTLKAAAADIMEPTLDGNPVAR